MQPFLWIGVTRAEEMQGGSTPARKQRLRKRGFAIGELWQGQLNLSLSDVSIQGSAGRNGAGMLDTRRLQADEMPDCHSPADQIPGLKNAWHGQI